MSTNPCQHGDKLPELPEWVTEIRDQAGIEKAFHDYARAAVELNRVVVTYDAVRKALAEYHLQHQRDDEADSPLSLFDVLTPPGDVDIGRGIEELNLLADYVTAALAKE